MDYLLYSLGTTGDALPFIRLTAALQAKGAKAVFAGSEKFETLAASMGAPFLPVSSRAAYESTYNNPLTWSRNHAQNHYNEFHFPAIKPTFKIVESAIQKGHRPTIVYQDALSGARMAADEFGLKSCQVVLAPQGIGSLRSPSYPIRRQVEERLWSEVLPQLTDKAKKDTFNRLVRPLINPARKELGLSEWSIQNLPSMEGSPVVLALFPEWFKPNPGDWPAQLRNTGFILGDTADEAGDNQIDDFIGEYGSPVVFTFGTGIPVTSHLVDRIRQVCRLVGKPGVFVAHSKEAGLVENGRFPVLTRTSIPFSYLFPRSALVVHHGGIGTCAQALACGVPQIISPYTFDQPDNAFLLWQLGISNSVDFLNDSADEIASTISGVLSSREAMQKIKEYQHLTVDQTDSSTDFLLSLH